MLQKLTANRVDIQVRANCSRSAVLLFAACYPLPLSSVKCVSVVFYAIYSKAASRIHEELVSDALTPIVYGRYLVVLNLYYQDLKNYMNEREYELSSQHSVHSAKHAPKSSAGDSLESKAVCDSAKGSDAGTSIVTIPGPHTPYEPPHELRERITNLLNALTARHDEMLRRRNILSCSVCKACIAEIQTISQSPSPALSA
jgi:hypothetical protein